MSISAETLLSSPRQWGHWDLCSVSHLRMQMKQQSLEQWGQSRASRSFSMQMKHRNTSARLSTLGSSILKVFCLICFQEMFFFHILQVSITIVFDPTPMDLIEKVNGEIAETRSWMGKIARGFETYVILFARARAQPSWEYSRNTKLK